MAGIVLWEKNGAGVLYRKSLRGIKMLYGQDLIF